MQNNRPDKGAVEGSDETKATTFRLPSSVRKKFNMLLALRGESMQTLMADTVYAYIEANQFLLDEPIRKKKAPPKPIKRPSMG